MTEIVAKAWEIVNDPMSQRIEVLAALREIRAANKDVFANVGVDSHDELCEWLHQFIPRAS